MSTAQKVALVTGASGFVASHVISHLLKAGWTVKGTVRSTSKAQHILDLYPSYADKLSLVEVPDLVTGEGLAEALKGVTAIAHTASPYILTYDDPLKDLIQPAVAGTLSVLKAAKAAGIKRIALTSSFAAVVDPFKGGAFRDYTFTSADWNPTTSEQALEAGMPGALVYSASKKLAEAAAHEFGKQNDLEIVALNPPMIYGPPLQAIRSRNDINTSSSVIYALISGPTDRPVPETRLPLFVHVKDVAEAHVKALEAPADKVAGKRYLLCGGSFFWEDAVKHLQKVRPALADRLPKLSDEPEKRETVAKMDVTPAHEELGMKSFAGWQETVEETIDALVEREKEWA